MDMVTAHETATVCNPELRLRLADDATKQLAAGFKALGHPVRLQIIDLISQGGGEICGCDIERHFDLTQPTISHHLKALRDAGLITSEAHAASLYHRVNRPRLEQLRSLLTAL
jgi:ArsR family transcriptional regulator